MTPKPRAGRIALKRVYDPPSARDGTRILVDGLWPRGLTKERAAIDVWCRGIAPSAALRKWFGHTPERWSEFRKRYAIELRANPEGVAALRKLMRGHIVTLLFAAHDAEHNNAVALATILGRRSPVTAAKAKKPSRKAGR